MLFNHIKAFSLSLLRCRQIVMIFNSYVLVSILLLVHKGHTSAFVPLSGVVPSFLSTRSHVSFPRCIQPNPLVAKKDGGDSDDPSSPEQQENEPVHYDDFDDFVPGNAADKNANPSMKITEVGSDEIHKAIPFDLEESNELSSLFQKTIQEDTKRQERITKNWSSGNWKCRGFSLDKFSSDGQLGQSVNTANEAKFGGSNDEFFEMETNSAANRNGNDGVGKSIVKISQLAFDETATGPGFGASTESIAVGRTDGSVYIVNLGEEYLTRFHAVPKLTMEGDWDGRDKNDGEHDGGVGVEMVSEEELKERNLMSLPSDLEMNSDESGLSSDAGIPFEIECQFQAHGKDESISALLFHDDVLYTAAKDIKVWKMDSVNGNIVMVPLHNLDSSKTDEVVALKTLSTSESQDASDHNLLLSASKDGSFSLWDMNGDLVYRCSLLDDDGGPIAINCADVDTSGPEHVIYLGLSSGHVVAYVASELVGSASEGNECPVPKCKFLAHDPSSEKNRDSMFTGVTAISCGGYGRSSGTAVSSFLVTGGADGAIKQWEMIQQKRSFNDDGSESKVEWNLMHWPRLPTQRMKDRAHLLKGHYEGPITALEYEKGEATKILSAAADGTLRVWDPTAEEELYRMDGFEGVISSICLDGEVLVTNGMSDYVCVHDFDEEDHIDSSYELDW